MVYDSDFYTTRRTYSRPVVTSYSVSSKKEIPWEKVPYVPRPRLIADPITAFGRPKTKYEDKRSIIERINKDAIQPSREVLARPIEPYVSAREKTRQRVFDLMHQYAGKVDAGGSLAASTFKDSMDIVLPRAHKTATNFPEKHLHIIYNNNDEYKY